MPPLTATSIMSRYKRLEPIRKYVDKPDDPIELARKVALFVGENNEDAVMTFFEDGSTRDELEFRAISILLHN
jgi:hypothetical protein